ncbi:hypothetical protein G7Y89_g389 [Cudoniella acicularis]|uniref:Peptidase S8/S53 domain-containing protein n=1 Tax=Cudoniella acicularis TaxID=354080 RepID=A0A8H4RX94_9HELO|nr:hypothetical protein G7Y89_g389 [Cudoniella acicularis]
MLREDTSATQRQPKASSSLCLKATIDDKHDSRGVLERSEKVSGQKGQDQGLNTKTWALWSLDCPNSAETLVESGAKPKRSRASAREQVRSPRPQRKRTSALNLYPSSASAMETLTKESTYWQLFKSVRPLFASDIPWEAQHDQDDVSTKIAIENTGDLIKACMLEIPIHVRMEHFDTLDGFALFIADDLRPFLFILQELVHDKIMEYVDIAAINHADQKLQKLNALGHMMQSSITDVFDVKEYLKFLCFSQDPGYLRKTLTGIENFNKRLVAEMSKNRPDRLAIPKSKTTSRSTSENPISWLQTSSNHSFWSSSQKLFKALVLNLGSCKLSTHSAMLNLKGLRPPKLQDEQAKFDILLPSCPKQGFWQEISCHVLYQSPSESDAEDDMLPENVCQAVQIANNYGFMLHIRVHEESFRYDYCADQQPLYPKALPTMTVSQLIDCGFLKDLRGFHLKDRWKLALNLAQSLLQLHNGPWLQTLWTSENVFFLCENPKEGRKLCNIHNPFVSCIISDSPPSLPKPSHFDRYPLLLTFGLFLLELANGEKLPVTTTKTGDFSPYKTLMDNFNEMNTGSLSGDYKEAIEGCLRFQKFVKDERGSDEEVRIRTTIFKKIDQPLERNLRFFSKVPVSADINVARTEENGHSLDALGPRDLHIKDGILLATSQVSGPFPLRTSHSPAPGRTGSGQVGSLEPSNYQHPTLGFSISHAAYVSQLEQHLYRIVTITEKDNESLQSPATEVKATVCQGSTSIAVQRLQPYCEQTDNSDASPSSESEFESDEAGGRLLGKFDTNDSEMQESASLEWGKTFKSLSRIYGSRFQHMFSDEPVKVAILDTGIDRNHPDFQHPRSRPRKGGIISPVEGEEAQIKRIKVCQNFCDDRIDVGDVTDIDGHGTHVAGIILQLAPRAELYIARAIEWAIGHRVQLINMSFGYKNWDPKLDQALKKAQDHGIVILAAASNFGNHEQVAWPARDRERAICVHSSIDLGTDCSEFTPKAHSGTINFMAVGERVCSHWPVSKNGGYRTLSGTSTATPVVTAIAALLLAFTRQGVVDKEKKKDVEDDIGPVRLEELWSMRALLEHICTEVENYYWIRPHLLWSQYKPTKRQENDPSAATKYAWEEIRRALRSITTICMAKEMLRWEVQPGDVEFPSRGNKHLKKFTYLREFLCHHHTISSPSPQLRTKMSQSSGRLAGKMKWLVTRYPKAPGELIALGAILSDPEEPETRLNRHDAKEIDPKYILDESAAVQRTIQAEVSNNDSILLKVAEPLLGAGLNVDGKLSKDRKTVVDALDVKAKIFLPDKEYIDASVEVPGVQEYVRKCNFSKTLYMIIGVASAKKLSVDEEKSQQNSARANVTAAPPRGFGTEVTAEALHSSSKNVGSWLKIEEECDFAYRIREFTYWRHRRLKVKIKDDRSTGALFGTGNGDDDDGDDDDDNENCETVALFNDLKDNDVTGSASGLSTF